MSHLTQITKRAQELSDAEWTALGPALANNRPADFDTEDIIRLTIYRRAIHAGMYANRQEDQTATRLTVPPALTTPPTSPWLVGYRAWRARV